MPIQVVCPHCDASYQVDSDLEGQRIRCRDCKARFIATDELEASDSKVASKRAGFPTWVLILAICIPVGLAPVGVVVFAVVLGQSARQASQNLKGNYPPPVTKCDGFTADHWGEQAKDVNYARCARACKNLHQLGSEGVPFLLELARFHEGRPDHQACCFWFCNGSLVQEGDLDIVAEFLDEKYAPTDYGSRSSQGFTILVHEFEGEEIPSQVRYVSLRLLQQAGPKAKPQLPRLHALAAAHPSSFPLDANGKPMTAGRSPDYIADWLRPVIKAIEGS